MATKRSNVTSDPPMVAAQILENIMKLNGKIHLSRETLSVLNPSTNELVLGGRPRNGSLPDTSRNDACPSDLCHTDPNDSCFSHNNC
jgi:hypothetical protein